MERVLGIGGIFFKARDPAGLAAWYRDNLGVPIDGEQLRAAGAQVGDRTEDFEYGRFGWALDPEGNRIELWQPMGGGF